MDKEQAMKTAEALFKTASTLCDMAMMLLDEAKTKDNIEEPYYKQLDQWDEEGR